MIIPDGKIHCPHCDREGKNGWGEVCQFCKGTRLLDHPLVVGMRAKLRKQKERKHNATDNAKSK